MFTCARGISRSHVKIKKTRGMTVTGHRKILLPVPSIPFALSSRRRRLDKCKPNIRLNANKTQVLWLGSRYNIDRLTVREVPVLTSTVGVVGSALDLCVVIDSRLSMADHVASVCRSAYYHLGQIRPTLSLPRDAAKTLVHAFISSRLDYCNSVLYSVNNLLQRLQSVQNAAVRLITQTGRHEHISPVLQLFDTALI